LQTGHAVLQDRHDNLYAKCDTAKTSGTPVRPASEIARWRRERNQWIACLAPESLFHRLFDHIPGLHFFAKNEEGRLMFASAGLLQRYQMRDDSGIIAAPTLI